VNTDLRALTHFYAGNDTFDITFKQLQTLLKSALNKTSKKKESLKEN
jgi:hypothetical protein